MHTRQGTIEIKQERIKHGNIKHRNTDFTATGKTGWQENSNPGDQV